MTYPFYFRFLLLLLALTAAVATLSSAARASEVPCAPIIPYMRSHKHTRDVIEAGSLDHDDANLQRRAFEPARDPTLPRGVSLEEWYKRMLKDIPPDQIMYAKWLAHHLPSATRRM